MNIQISVKILTIKERKIKEKNNSWKNVESEEEENVSKRNRLKRNPLQGRKVSRKRHVLNSLQEKISKRIDSRERVGRKY